MDRCTSDRSSVSRLVEDLPQPILNGPALPCAVGPARSSSRLATGPIITNTAITQSQSPGHWAVVAGQMRSKWCKVLTPIRGWRYSAGSWLLGAGCSGNAVCYTLYV